MFPINSFNESNVSKSFSFSSIAAKESSFDSICETKICNLFLSSLICVKFPISNVTFLTSKSKSSTNSSIVWPSISDYFILSNNKSTELPGPSFSFKNLA